MMPQLSDPASDAEGDVAEGDVAEPSTSFKNQKRGRGRPPAPLPL